MPWKQAYIELQDRNVHALVDYRFSETAPIAELPCINWIGLWACEPVIGNNYIPENEQHKFKKVEMALIEIAGQQAYGWAVGCIRLLSRGIAEFYFYSKDEETLAQVVPELKKQFPEYRAEFKCKRDETWSEYFKYLSAIQ